MKQWIFYGLLFALGYFSSFLVGKTLLSVYVPALKTYDLSLARGNTHQSASSPLSPHISEKMGNSEAVPFTQLPEDAQEEIDMTVDLSLPSLQDMASSKPTQLRKACQQVHRQYHFKNRYEWAKSYMGLETQRGRVLRYYIQDDGVWERFTFPQQHRLMEDLLYCHPSPSSDITIMEIQILSSKDSHILSRYQRGGTLHDTL